MASDGDKRLTNWPKTPRGLAGALNRLAPNLRQVDVHVERGTAGSGNGRRNIITIDQRATPARNEDNA